jgi:molybdopterin/thiamine biosynthesis adenylyltransferase
MSLIGGYDLVLDGSDNFETRYLLSDAFLCRQATTDHGGAGDVRRIADHDPGA